MPKTRSNSNPVPRPVFPEIGATCLVQVEDRLFTSTVAKFDTHHIFVRRAGFGGTQAFKVNASADGSHAFVLFTSLRVPKESVRLWPSFESYQKAKERQGSLNLTEREDERKGLLKAIASSASLLTTGQLCQVLHDINVKIRLERATNES